MTLIIGIGNKARHGKDTAGEAVVDHYARHAAVFYKHGLTQSCFIKAGLYKFADVLYAEVNEWLTSESGKLWTKLGHDGCEFFNPGFVKGTEEVIVKIPTWVTPDPNPLRVAQAPYGKHPKLLQWWGTEYRRAQDPDYWVKKTLAKIMKDNPDVALITDTRFLNEAQAIKNLGGYTLNISRLNGDGTPFVAPDRPADHVSETALDGWNWDLKIINSDGHAALTGELAITYVEYLRGLHGV